VSRWLARPSLPYKAAAVSIFVLLPVICGGLLTDDVLHRLIVEGRFGSAVGRFDLFDFVNGSERQRANAAELGLYPWWVGAQVQISYWRPVVAVTHFIDYSCWPRWAWLMHLESLAWYGFVVVAAGAFYRRFVALPWVAGLATMLYAFDHSHSVPATWIANRGALMSAVFGILSLLAHDRWRRRRRRYDGVLAAALFALAPLCAESGIAIAGYLVAYEMCLDGGRPLGRVLALMPYGVVTTLWRVVYGMLGYGVRHSGVAADPVIETGRFIGRAVQSIPLLIASEVFAIPADLLGSSPRLVIGGALLATALLAFITYALSPAICRNVAARFFFLGALLSAIPMGGVFPNERYLFWAGLGVIGVIATSFEAVLAKQIVSRFGPWTVGTCVFLHGVLSPIVFPFRGAPFAMLQDSCVRVAETVPDGTYVPDKTVAILNTPFELMATLLPVMRIARHEPIPKHLYVLYGGLEDISVTRPDAQTLDVTSRNG
jgi:hypothetical protein